MRYLLGLSDLTGELMRFAINAVTSPDPLAVIEHVQTMLRTIYNGASCVAEQACLHSV